MVKPGEVPVGVRETAEGICPFCGAKIMATTEVGDGMVTHGMPPCDMFVALDPVDYLHAVNARLIARTQ